MKKLLILASILAAFALGANAADTNSTEHHQPKQAQVANLGLIKNKI